MCGHEFTNRDLTTPAERLYVSCPKCSSTAWLPRQQIGFTQRNYTTKLPPTPLGGRLAQTIQLAVSPHRASIRGRVATKAKWLVSPTLQNNVLSFVVDTHALAVRRSHTASLEVVSDAGVATVTVEVYVESPPAVAVAPHSLDFGIVRANETRTLNLEMRNTGEQVLSGQIACADGWLTLDKPAFAANQHTVRCTVSANRLPRPGVNTTTLAITSNGGALNVLVRVEGLPPMLTVTPQALDFQIERRRSIAPQPLVIENVGVGRLTGTVHSDATWLKIRDDIVHANYLETLIEVDSAALEPGQTAAGAVRIVTNGGEIDVPVTVQVASLGLLERLVASGRLTTLILSSIVIVAAWMGIKWWEPAPPATSTPIYTATPTALQATPTLSSKVPTNEPVAIQPPSPVMPTLNPSPSPLLSATFTQTPGATTSLQFLERLRTLVAQNATQTAVAGATVTAATPAVLPAVTTPSAQCSDPRAVVTTPLLGQTLRGNAPVYGTAEHAAFRYYKIEIAPQQAGEERFSFVADNDAPVIAGLLAEIDTTRFTNGAYILQLTVIDRSGNFPVPCQVAVNFEN